ncbi:glycine--tRNA ligase subunit beta [Bacillaceae bacterium SIJ1]|uniref:glycine--tRNA ligase subunit beta n=1 Tax=Litoribacterium kuwaitense TaxID=1398745 RepID=UPI0013EB1DCB|nr:glycine--tRNA ligase subunit beta [Litoribacterium kuwaitense]NGP43529.1 glycine--tRNA ligase subunit beta [Litoribacterium kuwaitense]
MTRRFLLEIGLEELPAQFVQPAEQDLRHSIEAWLKEQRLSFQSVLSYSTPRRLVVAVEGLSEKQSDLQKEMRGPAKRIALDEEGNWTKAAQGFAKGQGVAVADLTVRSVKDQEYIFAQVHEHGQPTEDLLPGIRDVITQLSFPKSMRWANSELRYLRPIRWLVALYGDNVVPFTIEGVQSGHISRGHRFLGHDVSLAKASDYEELLRSAYVIVDPNERRKMVTAQMSEIEEKQQWKIQRDEALFAEVINLVEYPTVLFGRFATEFLELPEVVLITTMKEHQRYFAVKTEEDTLAPYFVTVRNGDSAYLDNVQRGNEKVLHARLKDAQFFYHEDQKLTIGQAQEKLKTVVFHENLKTMFDKSERNEKFVRTLTTELSFDEATSQAAARAAKIGKFDLVTYMVDEFSELQGKMGEVYALAKGENELVAKAIDEQYNPRSAEGQLPQTKAGAIVALADKMDTIAAFFSKGLIPTGSQDPFALRRQAYGVVQILRHYTWPTSFAQLSQVAVQGLEAGGLTAGEKTVQEMIAFLTQRLKALLLDEGVAHDIVESLLDIQSGVHWTFAKANALTQARNNDPSFKLHVEAMARVANLAEKSTDDTVNSTLLKDPNEQQLFAAHETLKAELAIAIEQQDAARALEVLSRYTPVITQFFDKVMVMAEDEKVKRNRLALMATLQTAFLSYADMRNIHV